MKSKLDWKGVGQFIAMLVQIWSIIKVVVTEAKVGLEILDWVIGNKGKEWCTSWLRALVEEYKKSLPTPEDQIYVDRSVKPSYPEWTMEVICPELELLGPAEYNITAVDQWLHEDQKNGGCVKGQIIYDHLKATEALKTCLGLRDLEEIQKKGVAFFCKHFKKGNTVFGWRSIVRNRCGFLFAPYLFEYGGELILLWGWLEDVWVDSRPALRFASKN